MKRSLFHASMQFLLAIAMAVCANLVPLGTSPSIIWLCLGAFYWCAIKAVLSPVRFEEARPSWITGEILFLVFAYILLFFPYQLSVLNATDLWFSRFVEFAFVEYTNPSLLASTSGVLAFSAGIRLLPSRNTPPVLSFESKNYVDAFLLMAIALQLGVISMLAVSGGLAQMSEGAYMGSTTNDRTQDGLYLLATVFSMMGSAGVWYRRWRHNYFGIIAIVCVAVSTTWGLVLILLGDRNSFLLISIVTLAGLSLFFYRIGPTMIASLLIFAIIGYNVVEVSRQSATRDFSSLVSAIQSKENRDFSESSFTNTTVTSRAAFALVPASYPYFFGKFKAVGVAGVVPYSRGLFVNPNDTFITSADVITAGVLGNRSTWSLGTNVISDVYVEFGVIGVPLFLLTVGLLIAFVTRKFLQYRSMKWSIIYMMSVALLAELPRYSIDFPVRPLVWTFVLLSMFGVGWKLITKRKLG